MIIKYLHARAVALAADIERCEAAFKTWAGNHPGFACVVQQQLAEQRQRLQKLQRAAKVGQFERGLTILRQAWRTHKALTEFCLPALHGEREAERSLGHLLGRAALDVGATHVVDMVISQNKAWGTAVLESFHDYPIIHIPLYKEFSLLELAFFYHELAHTIWRRDEAFLIRMETSVSDYFRAFSGPHNRLTNQAQQRKRQKHQACHDYWTSVRLEELFCDCFAACVAGPAYAYAWMDYVARDTPNPFTLNEADEHPPDAFRMQAILTMLGEDLNDAGHTAWIRSCWERLCSGQALGQEGSLVTYDAACTPALAERLVGQVRSLLAERGYKSYVHRLPPEEEMFAAPIPTVMNAAVIRLLEDPAGYQRWESQVMAHMLKGPAQ